jgi:hypothetical protein
MPFSSDKKELLLRKQSGTKKLLGDMENNLEYSSNLKQESREDSQSPT